MANKKKPQKSKQFSLLSGNIKVSFTEGNLNRISLFDLSVAYLIRNSHASCLRV